MAEQNVVIKIQADVSKATNNIKVLQEAIAKLSTSGTQAATGTEKVSNAAKKTATASQLLDKEIKKIIAGEANLDKVADLATAALKEQTAAAERLAEVSAAVEEAVGKKGKQMLEGTGQVKSLGDASGAASFALLSMGQAFQDSAQFGMGLAQGLRAVNNNIQQVFTSIALGSAQAGSLKNFFAEMRGQLFGPGGAIIAFSIITAGLEFFANRAQQAAKETKLLNDALGESAERAIEVTGITQKQYEFEISSLSKVVSGLETRISLADDLVAKEERLAELQTASFDMSDRIPALEQEISRLKAEGVIADGEELEANKAVLEVLKQKLAEARANQLIQQTLQDLGAQEVEQVKTSAELFKQQTAEAARRNEQAGALPPILDAQVELYKMMGEAEKAAEVAATARELRELGIKAAIDAQNLALQQRADAAGEDSFLPEGDLELGKRLITDADRAMQRLNKTFQNTAAQGMTQVISGFAEMAFSGASFSSAILGPIADMAISLGKIAIGTAIAIKGIRSAFESMNPVAAFAAGVALVALGTAVKSRIKAAGRGASSGAGGGGGGSSAAGMIRGASMTEFNVGNLYSGTPNIGSAAGFPSLSIGSMAPQGMQLQLVARGPDLVSAVDAQRSANTRLIGGSR